MPLWSGGLHPIPSRGTPTLCRDLTLTASLASLQETSEDVAPPLPSFHFQRLLANLTSLRLRVSPGPSPAGQ